MVTPPLNEYCNDASDQRLKLIDSLLDPLRVPSTTNDNLRSSARRETPVPPLCRRLFFPRNFCHNTHSHINNYPQPPLLSSPTVFLMNTLLARFVLHAVHICNCCGPRLLRLLFSPIKLSIHPDTPSSSPRHYPPASL